MPFNGGIVWVLFVDKGIVCCLQPDIVTGLRDMYNVDGQESLGIYTVQLPLFRLLSRFTLQLIHNLAWEST